MTKLTQWTIVLAQKYASPNHLDQASEKISIIITKKIQYNNNGLAFFVVEKCHCQQQCRAKVCQYLPEFYHNIKIHFLGLVSNFTVAVLLCTLALFSKSFHNFGSSVNSMDIAPKHSGSIFGIINAIGCTAGTFYILR